MSTRQYIGARYVPKFFENSATGDSTWAANTTYEPLTMVMWNSVVYTSKKYVPASVGNPSENASYWVATSNASEQIAQLAEQVAALDDTVGDISDSVDDIEDKFGSNGALKVSGGGTGGTTGNAACTNIGAVKKSGDTMTGNLIAEGTGDIKIEVINDTSSTALQMTAGDGGSHGLWSVGYYDGDNFVSNGAWLARRAPVSGNFIVAGNVAIKTSTIASGATLTYTFPSQSNHGFVFVSGNASNTHGIAAIDTYADGEVANAFVMVAASAIEINKSTNQVTIKNNSSAYVYIVYIGCAGNGPVVS